MTFTTDEQEYIDELLNYDRIREWAGRQEATSSVGFAANRMSCPFANCLNDIDPAHLHEVSKSRVQIDDEGRIQTPDWMYRAIGMIDQMGGSISGSQFFSILDQVKSEEVQS